MLTKRIIPCLDVENGRVVKGTSFAGLRDAGDPVELASFYYQQNADELVFLDITATPEDRKTIVSLKFYSFARFWGWCRHEIGVLAEECGAKCFMPLTIDIIAMMRYSCGV